MTAATVTTAPTTTTAPHGASGTSSKLTWAVKDTLALGKRNLLHYTRVPQLLVFTFVQPIMFVLLFRYVFGGTIIIPGQQYVNYLMPGIFTQTVVFGSTATAIGLAEDLGSGIIERFRSLPMVRMAVLSGRTGADLVRNTGVVLVMLAVGFAVGFRPQGSLPAIVLGLLIVLAFAFSLSWVMAFIGLKAANAEAAQAVAFPIMFPLTFASSAFVPVNSMPGWLQAFAEHQPVTIVVNAARGLMLGPEAAQALQKAGVFTTDTTGYVLRALLWMAAILAVFVPLAVRQFNKS
ncbi:ABC transporter permease [Aquihabitans sp. McL0605]|uniref:ABC transporter permease n=1 Tax=Aquihabitans sp. McL0605 TaxID=3415671 RepID=UPI003CF0E138